MEADHVSAPDSFIREYENLVFKIAHKIHRRFTGQIDLEDLIGWGYIGLMEAHQRYQEEIGTQFATYAYYRIRGAILDALSNVRSDQEVRTETGYNEIFETYAHVVVAQGHQASIEGRLARISTLSGNLAMICILAEPPETSMRSQAAPHQQALIRHQTHQKVRDTLERLPQTERDLLKGFYFEGRSLSEMATAMGYSPSWASRVHNRALERLRGMINSDTNLDDLRHAVPV